MKESLNLLLGLFERVPDRRRRRGAHLELRDHAVDAFGVGIDGPAVVAAHADREGDVEDVLGHVVPKLAEAVLRFGRAGRMRLPRVGLAGLVIDHGPSMTKSPPGGSILEVRWPPMTPPTPAVTPMSRPQFLALAESASSVVPTDCASDRVGRPVA